MRIQVNTRSAIFAAALLALLQSCGSAQVVSERDVTAKVAKITLGSTTKAEVEAIFGPDHGREPRFWVYNLSDTKVELALPKTAVMSGVMPLIPSAQATNTRALVTVRFSRSDVVNGLEVARYFEAPFTHEYWHLIKKDASEKILEAVIHAGESNGFKVEDLDKSAGTLNLQAIGNKARIAVAIDQPILHFSSTNPHDRQSNEYRVFIKREVGFTEKLSASELLE